MALSEERREARRRHIVEAAHALIREMGGADFSMSLLARRAGVSPATPYNLLGSKSEILRLIVREEFSSFETRLGPLSTLAPLDRLLAATDLVVTHYEADGAFYRGLYAAAFSAEAPEVHDLMMREGRLLWRGLTQGAIASGELRPIVRAEPLTDLLLRTISAVTLAWLSEHWSEHRFAGEMAYSIRLTLAGVARADARERLLADMSAAQAMVGDLRE